MRGEGLSLRALWWLRRSWTALVIAAVALSPFELAGALDLAAALMLLAFAYACHRSRGASANLRVWQLGLLLVALSLFAEPLLAGRPLEAFASLSPAGRLPYRGCGAHVLADAPLQPDWTRNGRKTASASSRC